MSIGPMLAPMGTPGLTPGVHRPVILQNPAAGVGFSLPTGGGAWTKLAMGAFRLTTSAVVATRAVTVAISDADGNNFYRVAFALTQPASAALNYSFGSLVPAFSTASGAVAMPFPDIWLPPGWVISVFAGGIDAGDQFDRINLYLFEIDPDESYPIGRLDEYPPRADLPE